jgi:hypothetical protein
MRTKLAFAAAAVAVAASLSFAVNGLATTQLPGRFLDTPAAAAGELVPFEDCEELRQWYVERALPDVGAYGFGHGSWFGPRAMRDVATVDRVSAQELASPSKVAGADTVVESSSTGTNVQEVGVDEPDRAKTDGELVVHVRGSLLVVTDVTDDAPRELGTLRLPRRLGNPELLLSGDTVLVLGGITTGRWGVPMPVDGMPTDLMDRSTTSSRMMPQAFESSRLVEVSLSDPSSPRIESDQTFGGSLVSARQYAGTGQSGTVRLVLRTGLPTLDFVFPGRDRTRAQAKAANREIVRESEIGDWLPTVARGDGERAPLVDCADVRHPRTGSEVGTLTIVTLPSDDPTSIDADAVTTGGETVYSSTDRLYLATWAEKGRTEVHAFALDGTATAYVASGVLDGTVRDRWSLDEHKGVLRVAVAHGRSWSPTDNGITTLEEVGDTLRVVGTVRDLGPTEEIKSVRWLDDLAIVVTFRQTDPLYTVDLSDPRRPRTLGALKIPGFSEYLHPIGDDRLLGLGQDATLQGRTRGGQASLFDIGDLASPERVATLALGRHAHPATSYDPRSFTWIADRSTALVALDDHGDGRAVLVEITVTDDGSLAEGQRWPLPRWEAGSGRALPLPDGSVAVVGDEVRLISIG